MFSEERNLHSWDNLSLFDEEFKNYFYGALTHVNCEEHNFKKVVQIFHYSQWITDNHIIRMAMFCKRILIVLQQYEQNSSNGYKTPSAIWTIKHTEPCNINFLRKLSTWQMCWNWEISLHWWNFIVSIKSSLLAKWAMFRRKWPL